MQFYGRNDEDCDRDAHCQREAYRPCRTNDKQRMQYKVTHDAAFVNFLRHFFFSLVVLFVRSPSKTTTNKETKRIANNKLLLWIQFFAIFLCVLCASQNVITNSMQMIFNALAEIISVSLRVVISFFDEFHSFALFTDSANSFNRKTKWNLLSSIKKWILQ